MALVYVDSFDHYTTITDKGWIANFNGIGNGIGAFGRNGTSGQRINNSTGRGITRVLPGSYSTIVVGFAVRSTGWDNNVQLLQLSESGTNHIQLRTTAAGRLQVCRSTTQIGSTGTATLTTNLFYYVELKVTIHDSTGSFEVRVNGTTDITGSSLDTRNGGTSGVIDTLVLGDNTGSAPNFSVNLDWDDLYVLDTSGSSPTNDFLGDVRIEALLPDNNGNSSQLVGSDGNSTNNYQLVDESAPNGDTDYVESSTVGDKDTYSYGNLTSTTGTVYGVQILPYAKKTDAGVRSIKSVARLSGTETDSSDKTLSTSYGYLPDIRETKPGGGAWSISDVNSAEFGVKVSA